MLSSFPLPLREVVRPTTLLESPRLNRKLGAKITLASETFQHTGSFKFRAAYNVASKVKQDTILAASSGNFGQGMAYACHLLGKKSIVVMPSTSARVKIEAVREYGGEVDLIDVTRTSRADRVKMLAAELPGAYVASGYDDPLVIEGNASLGDELVALGRPFDFIVVPIGGGGLSSGIVTALRGKGVEGCRVVGAEPLVANDAARSLRAGHIIANETEPQTMADGARVLRLGDHNWEILRSGLSGIVEVAEEQIAEGVRLLFSLINLKVEPTGALAVGVLLARPELFRGRQVCCVLTGGNVDPETYAAILTGGAR